MSCLFIIIFFFITILVETIIVRFEIKQNIDLFYALYRQDVIKVLKKENRL